MENIAINRRKAHWIYQERGQDHASLSVNPMVQLSPLVRLRWPVLAYS
jgi:hypothetical protein